MNEIHKVDDSKKFVVDVLVYRAVRYSGNALDLRSQSHIVARSRSSQEALSTCIGVSTTLAIADTCISMQKKCVSFFDRSHLVVFLY